MTRAVSGKGFLGSLNTDGTQPRVPTFRIGIVSDVAMYATAPSN